MSVVFTDQSLGGYGTEVLPLSVLLSLDPDNVVTLGTDNKLFADFVGATVGGSQTEANDSGVIVVGTNLLNPGDFFEMASGDRSQLVISNPASATNLLVLLKHKIQVVGECNNDYGGDGIQTIQMSADLYIDSDPAERTSENKNFDGSGGLYGKKQAGAFTVLKDLVISPGDSVTVKGGVYIEKISAPGSVPFYDNYTNITIQSKLDIVGVYE